MADCPPDAIHRAPDGEVFIDDSCIGCGNCENNCPYGVIQLASPPKEKSSLLSWLLFGKGSAPGEEASYEAGLLAERTKNGEKQEKDLSSKKAVKCDMCKDVEGGASCVNACPTGAAARVSPEKFMDIAMLSQ
jgi:Fe-S-cluster-containing hydrogenase component 2